MIALYDFVPEYCPGCGSAMRIKKNADNPCSYNKKYAHFCYECGLQFQFVETELLTEAAEKAGGDLARYT